MSKKEKIISRLIMSVAIIFVVVVVGWLIWEGVQLFSDLNNAIEDANEVTTKTIRTPLKCSCV